MAGHFEARGELRHLRQRAACKVIDFPAAFALEMMMMAFACHLIASRFSRDFNGGEPFLFHQRVDIAVDGGLANAFYQLACGVERFFWRKRARRCGECFADGFFLPGVSNLYRHAVLSVCAIDVQSREMRW